MIVYVNGAYVQGYQTPSISPFDRGYQFADGLYEGLGVHKGAYYCLRPHLARLLNHAQKLNMAVPYTVSGLAILCEEVRQRNKVTNGIGYIQLTRGVARRDHGVNAPLVPSLVIACHQSQRYQKERHSGIKALLTPDWRHDLCEYKSLSLLANVCAKQQARCRGMFESILYNQDDITEGSSSNVWIVDQEGCLRTHPANGTILNGLSRSQLIVVARQAGYTVKEDAFTIQDLANAKEVFLTATSYILMPVATVYQAQKDTMIRLMPDIKTDNQISTPLFNHGVGPVARRLQTLLQETLYATP
jgi:D-alanine transaminase